MIPRPARAPAPWMTFGARPSAKARLYCFPHAGGNAGVFRSWPHALPPQWEVRAVHLPGRLGRLDTPPFRGLDPLVGWLLGVLGPHLHPPFAFFGHSMGALIAFELARALRREGLPQPVLLALSGHRAPQLPDTRAATYDLPHDEFISELRRMNGTPPDVFRDAELLELLLPALRADLQLCETYTYRREVPLAVPLAVFTGTDDALVDVEQARAWAQQTTRGATVRIIEGDHFFIQSNEARFLSELRDALQNSEAWPRSASGSTGV